MRNALIIAYYFPPIAASGSLRALGFCRYLEQHGWLPRVLTTDPKSVYPFQGIDHSLVARLPDSLRVDTVPHANPLQAMIRSRDKLRDRLQSLLHHSVNRWLPTDNRLSKQVKSASRGQLSSLKEFVLDWAFSFPDPQRSWLRPAVRCLSRLQGQELPAVVFATGSPWSGLLVGRALARRFGVPFVADLRDPWIGIPGHNLFSSSLLVSRARRLERSVFADAACVVMNTEELRFQYNVIYPEFAGKFVTITNGFDGEAYESAIDSADGAHNPWMELCHFGTVYGNRSPLPLLTALSELLEENLIDKGRLRLRFVGKWDVLEDGCETIARHLEKQGVLRREPPLPQDICFRQMAQARALIVLQPRYPLQIPAKLYEYIGSGRPLVVIGGEGATANMVQRYALGECYPNEVADLKTLLRRLATDQICLEPSVTPQNVQFDYRTLTGQLADILNKVCSAGPERLYGI